MKEVELMSKWLDLKEKIESIPEKERHKNLVGKLARYSKMTAVAQDSLARSLQSQRSVQQVFPKGNFQRNADLLHKAASAAKTLHKKLVKQIEAVETELSDKQFLTIDDCAKAAQGILREQWKNLLSGKIDGFEKLVNAASEANLAGSKKLTEILNRLREDAVNPPNNDNAAMRIATNLEGLNNSIGTLGLKGRAGQFLVAAAEGRGNPQDLCDREIVDFIERCNLWNLLSVKLR
jgi:hypothetical protein